MPARLTCSQPRFARSLVAARAIRSDGIQHLVLAAEVAINSGRHDPDRFGNASEAYLFPAALRQEPGGGPGNLLLPNLRLGFTSTHIVNARSQCSTSCTRQFD